MKTKTRTVTLLELDAAPANSTLTTPRTIEAERRHQEDALQLPLAAMPIATKSEAEIAVTLRARLDGTFQVCRCNGTGADGCIIDGPIIRVDPRRGFASHRPANLLGPGSTHE